MTDSVSVQQHPRHDVLFGSTSIGDVELTNRIALAPMTRVSATADGMPTDRIGAYYRVFADGGFGLLITEGLYIDDQMSQGYLFQPGVANRAQAEAWRPVVETVHISGAKFFAQLMHAGSQSQGNPHSPTTWGPSAVRPKGEQLGMYRGSGPYRIPEAMTAEHIGQVRTAFVNAARFARDAGFDGVEIHGANGYLLDAFLTDYMNTRTDAYGATSPTASGWRRRSAVTSQLPSARTWPSVSASPKARSRTTTIGGRAARTTQPRSSPRWPTPASTTSTPPNTML